MRNGDRVERSLDWAAERTRALTSGRVLDVGCGDGRFLPPGGIGVDVDRERLRSARARSPLLVQADARALPFRDRAFDTAYAHRMLNDTGDVDRALADIARVLRPTGTLLVFTRARHEEGDRLDRFNGVGRLAPFFAETAIEPHPDDERAALFVARRPRSR